MFILFDTYSFRKKYVLNFNKLQSSCHIDLPSSSVFNFFLNWSIFASLSPFSSFLRFNVRVPKLPGFWFSVSSSTSSRTREYSSWFVMPIFVHITTMRFATGWLSSTSMVFRVPSNIRTLSVRSLRRYSSRSPFLKM